MAKRRRGATMTTSAKAKPSAEPGPNIAPSDAILPPLSRRGLLATAAVLPTVAGPAPKTPIASPTAWDLRFALAPDGTSLVVTEAESGDLKDAKSQSRQSLTWRILSLCFGPNAWFDMERPGNGQTAPRRINIRNVSYGGTTGQVVSLLFTQVQQRWRLSVASTLWGNPDAFSDPIRFESFQNGQARTSLKLPGEAVGAAIGTIFAGRLQLVPAKPGFTVSLDRDLVWSLRATVAALSCFSGQVTTSGLRFAWGRERLEDGKPGKIVFFGHAAAATSATGGDRKDGGGGPDATGENISAPAGLRLGPRDGHHTTLTIDQDKPLVLDLRVAASPLIPKLGQAVVGLHIPAGGVAVYERGAVIAGPVQASDLVATETSLLDTELHSPLRTVLWGKVAGAKQQQIQTPIGPLLVAPPDLESPAATPPPTPPPVATALPPASGTPLYEPVIQAELDATAATHFMLAACGDRQGAGDATLFVVSDSQASASAPIGLRRIAIDLALLQSSVAPPDTSFSRLTFNRADLQLIYEDGHTLFRPARTEFPRRHASSWVWAGAGVHAALDLSRATLTCARDYDLAKVRLRFQDLRLVFEPQHPGAPVPGPGVRPVNEACRVMQRADGTVIDGRPTLVVEFDPQHVMEEALFRPEPAPLPDVDHPTLTQDAILETLGTKPSANDRTAYRTEIRAAKIGNEAGRPILAFTQLANAFELAALAAGLAKDQTIYIGPFALAPDAMALARRVQARDGKAAIEAEVAAMLDRVKQAAADPGIRKFLLPVEDPPPVALPDALANARRNETLLEQQEPLYAVFREFWRDRFTQALADAANIPPRTNSDGLDLNGIVPLAATLLPDFFIDGNRPKSYADPAMAPWLAAAQAKLQGRFVLFVTGEQPTPDLMGARLSGTTRLAFRINCQPLAGLDGESAGTAGSLGPGPRLPGQGGSAFVPIPFTFEHLTDWSRHEPAVTRRAQKLFQPLPSGLLPPLGGRGADATDEAILTYQGISKGAITAERRLTEIRGALAVLPTELETAIEIPARLVLSTAQDAVWLTNRRLFGNDKPRLEQAGTAEPPGLAAKISAPHRLWSVRLAIQDISPGLRAVASPDLRPMALGRGLAPETMPGHGAPPRGPWAPWFIGPEQMDGVTLRAEDFTFDGVAATCPPPAPDAKPSPFRLIRYLCERLGLRSQVAQVNYSLFRTTLDANDRHHLVLQTSAYGLPVIGRRQDASGGTGQVDRPGNLIAGSGQIEPGEAFSLLDAKDGQAIYRPIPLDVQELTLTALGGSFLHDTRFIPAAGAVDLRGRKIFDGFSIERWQHEVVLGRDIRAEVVYKGYLMPFGHRASLVKLTERIFLTTPTQGIKAVLRQRMFLRIGTPLMRYPALGQPHGGRLWCGTAVEIVTKRSPDLLDPTTPDPTPDLPTPGAPTPPPPAETRNGRVFLGGKPGLAFWPRTDITPAGLVEFDILLDGAAVRLPLMFLDNIAATTTESLQAAADHYNGFASTLPPSLQAQLTKRRTVDIAGQAIRYAVEDRPGDTSFPTETLYIRVGGRLASGELSWTGPLGDFETTAVLEGADQPPFYPEMDRATIRLTQLERLSGAPAPAAVQFDGHYIRYGFPGTSLPPGAVSPTGSNSNPLCVFLDLRDLVAFKMGTNGDRAGGIGRPDSDIVALSRVKGPLGASGTITYLKKDGSQDGPLVTIGPTTAHLIDGPALDKGLTSLVRQFYAEPTRTAMIDPRYPSHRSGSGDGDLIRVADGAAGVTDNIKQLQSYFNGDAKLLGVITLKQLMTVMNIDAELPALKEVVQYGASALSTLDGFAADVRIRVLLPLQAAILRLNREWAALDAKLQKTQRDLAPGAGNLPSGVETLTLANLFPEVQDGLRDIGAALDAAIATEDAIALQDKLGAIFSAGRRLIRNLAILAAHPVERLEEAAGTRIRNLVNGLAGLLPDWATKAVALAADLPKMLRTEPGLLADQVVDWVSDPGPNPPATVDAQLADAVPTPFPRPDLKAIATRMLADVQTAATAFLNAVDELEQKLQAEAEASPKELLRSLLTQLFRQLADGNVDLTAIVDGATRDYVGALNTNFATAKTGLLNRLQAIKDDANDDLIAVKEALQAALEAYAAQLAADAAATVAAAYPLELAAIQAAAFRIARVVQAARNLATAAAETPPRIERVLGAAGTLLHEAFGYDDTVLQQAATGLATTLNSAMVTGISRFPIQLRPDTALPVKPDRFRREMTACATHAPPLPSTTTDPASTAPLRAIAEAIAGITESAQHAARANVVIHQNELALRLAMPDTVDRLIALSGDLLTLHTDLRLELDGLHCDLVTIMASVIGVADAAVVTADTTTLAHQAALLALISRTGGSVARRLQGIVGQVGKFATDHPNDPIYAGLIGSLFALTDGSNQSPVIDVASLRSKAATAETRLAMALARLVNTALGMLAWAALPRDQIETLAQSVRAMAQRAQTLGSPLDPEASDLSTALATLKTELQRWDQLGTVTTVTTVQGLMDFEVRPAPNALTVRLLFQGTAFNASFAAARAAEAKVLALRHGIDRAIAGLPDLLRARIEQRVLQSGAIAALGTVSRDFTKARDDVLVQADQIALIRNSARKALLVGACAPGAAPSAPCVDDLARETAFLETLGAAQAFTPAMRLQFQAYLAAWTTGNAAPQLVLHQFASLVADLARGDILSVLDLGAYRNLIDDAIANLVPTRIDMSYDFSSVVSKKPEPDNIFQPALGAPFGIAVRASIDLLKHQSNFAATAHLGPFDVKLIGQLVDALTLSFGGASFETGTGIKARFAVKYETFKIGEDLKFAQQLQAYLSPKEGSGLFIQPMSQGVGLEAGYGINLGIISIGASSFFNVTLNVSAELPFDDQQALFRVALGRRLAPFSISFLPFVGSGFFAIIANAQGPIGFEASFEFGAGGSIGFGPLTAQARIQVGVYVRLMKVKDGLSTTISGTFFAGGAASIWIFSFATSLYVRLGSADGGAMYGEAVFTFSFSLGIVDYDFSVTAYRREPAMGGGNGGSNGSSALTPPDDGAGIMFAGLDTLETRVAEPAALPGDKLSQRKAEPAVKSTAAKPRPVTNDVTDQAERWDIYSGYFNAKLLDEAALKWPTP